MVKIMSYMEKSPKNNQWPRLDVEAAFCRLLTFASVLFCNPLH